MGVDASVFAERAKRYYYFDRQYNLFTDMRDDMEQTRFTSAELFLLAHQNIEHWQKSGKEDAHRVAWNRGISQFAEEFHGDKFFVMNDSEDPGWHEFADTNGYTEWKPENIGMRKMVLYTCAGEVQVVPLAGGMSREQIEKMAVFCMQEMIPLPLVVSISLGEYAEMMSRTAPITKRPTKLEEL